MTRILEISSAQALDEAVRLLEQGEVIALPTDTLYGLAALAFNAEAVAKLYQVKQRPLTKAIPIFVASVENLGVVCREVPERALPWLKRYWPGGLSAILPAALDLPGIINDYGSTVAVRIPDHALVRALLARLKQPLAVTSANRSGQANPQTAQAVLAQLDGRIPLILDGGPTPGELASTVLDLTQTPPRILRQGVIRITELEQESNDQ